MLYANLRSEYRLVRVKKNTSNIEISVLSFYENTNWYFYLCLKTTVLLITGLDLKSRLKENFVLYLDHKGDSGSNSLY